MLSGGGARGIAHVGVLAALDSLGARPDLIVGTSMGAIVGALYAGGMSGRAIDSLTRSLPVEALFRAVEPWVPRGWAPLSPLLLWEQGERRFELQSPAIRESETAALLNTALLRANLLARGDFDSLEVPFRAVATDLATRAPVVLGAGDLARAVRASASIPLLFAPEVVNGRVLVDGGLSANVPVGIARALGAERVIVSDVRSELLGAADLTSPLAVADQLAGFLFRQPEDSLALDDVLIRHELTAFGSLDFAPAVLQRLLGAGRVAADQALGSAGCLPRGDARPLPLPARIGSIDATGLAPTELGTLTEILNLQRGGELDLDDLAFRLRRLGEAEAYRQVWLNPTGRGDSVAFALQIVRAPRRTLALDLAYDNELGGRVGAAALDRAATGLDLDASARLTLGRYVKDLELGVRRYFGLGRSRFAPTARLRLAGLGVRRFTDDGVQLAEAKANEVALFLGAERDLARAWLFDLGLDLRAWEAEDGDRSAGGAVLRAERRAESGPRFKGELVWTGTIRRAHGEVGAALELGRMELAGTAHVGWGEQLPLHAKFALGGDEGFPGLHLEERRGDRELLLTFQGGWRVRGPVSLTALIAVGRSADGGDLLGSDLWLGGARLGARAATPVGPVRVEYGLATNGRGAAVVRVGRWF